MTAKREAAIPAQDADAEVLREFDESTRSRVERIRQFGDAVRTAIRSRRQSYALKQAELAERLGVSVSTVSRLESGRGISGMDFEVALSALAELGAEPMLTLLDPNAPGACEVIDMTLTEPAAAPRGLGSEDAMFSHPAVAVGLKSELKAMREEMSRLTDGVQHLSQANQKESTE